MTMTSESDTITKKRGRPFGIFGPKRRQKEWIDQFIRALGGPGNVTPWEQNDVCRAVSLMSIAEEKRRQIDKHGASSANELVALARIEEVAAEAVRRLRLPESTSRHIKGIRRDEDAA
jgi:hypothetical protein